MFRLAALNEERTEVVTEEGQVHKGTKEAQEVQAFNLYNEALYLQQNNLHDNAVKVYEQLLDTTLISESVARHANKSKQTEEGPLKDPGLILKYSTHKNVANICASKGDVNAAMEHYLQAVMLDTSDVTLWYKIGILAAQLSNLHLSRHAFTQGLECNRNHWPCLDNLITVLYANLDYEHCLLWISKAFEQDQYFRKGIVFRKKIIGECPHLRKDMEHLFRMFDASVLEMDIEEEESKQYLEEALTLRKKRRELCVQPPNPAIPLSLPMESFTWKSLGKSLLATYEDVKDNDEPITVTNTIDFSNLSKKEEAAKEQTDQPINDSCKTTSPNPPILPIVCDSQKDMKQTNVTEESHTKPNDSETPVQVISEGETESRLPPSESSESAQNTLTDSKPMNEGNGADLVGYVKTNSCDGSTSQKKSVKRKRTLAEKMNEQENQSKRRSSRMRKSIQRHESDNQDSIHLEFDFRESLLQYLPRCLFPAVQEETQSMDEDSASQDSTTPSCSNTVPNLPSEVPEELNEKEELGKFISSHKRNCGVLHLLHQYCLALGMKGAIKWEKGTAEVFLSAFDISYPTVCMELRDASIENEYKKKFIMSILTYMECAIDRKFKKYSATLNYDLTQQEYECMYRLAVASCSPAYFESDGATLETYEKFVLRFHWLRSQISFLMGQKYAAMNELNTCRELCSSVHIILPNLEHSKEISSFSIQHRLESLKRHQTIKEVEELFQENKHSELIALIKPSLVSEDFSKNNGPHLGISDDTNELDEWPLLYQYLLQSVVKTEEPLEILSCIVSTLTKSVNLFFEAKNRSKKLKDGKGGPSSKNVNRWFSLIFACCKFLDNLFHSKSNLFSNVEQELMLKLAQGLMSVVHITMTSLQQQANLSLKLLTPEGTFSKSEGYIQYMSLPWELLYKVVKGTEGKPENEIHKENHDDYILPSSLKILLTAHDWLGEKGMCCVDGGKFLRFITKTMLSALREAESAPGEASKTEDDMVVDVEEKVETGRSLSPFSDNRDTLKAEIGQCFYCMFGYPNKIQKSSHLVDHSSQQAEMRWDDAIEIFQYFRPDIIPGFDSYKANTMLAELASLLTRIVKLVPEHVMVHLRTTLQLLNNLIDGHSQEDIISSTEYSANDMKVIKDIYYLLADYYFKNKEMSLAVKYYMFDLCISPKRFDSWAGFALARSSQLDERLRFCVPKKSKKDSSDLLDLAKAALLCFERAMKLDKTSTTLWIEFGSVAYWMHSYYSRQLQMLTGNSEEEEKSKRQKVKLLDLSEQCFKSALECDVEDVNNEEWLMQYMLGKISEKKRARPQSYLKRFNVSAAMLHRKHAKYPKKIQFKAYQNDYAIEALELHFRLHASILKLLQKEINAIDGFETSKDYSFLQEEDYDLFKEMIEDASDSHFIRRETLPFSPMDEKPGDGKGGRLSSGKLTVLQDSSPLKMGSLIPDSVADALASHLETDHQPVIDSGDNNSQTSVTSEIPEVKVQPDIALKSEQEAGTSEKKMTPQKQPFTNEKRMKVALYIVQKCVNALHVCLRRFPQHYKSLYRLAYLYHHCSRERRHSLWSRDIFMNSEKPWLQLSYMPAQGLLAERNKTNLFNGVWKIPVDEIDRPGSFGYHLYRCILLLLDVLLELSDHNRLFYLHNMLNRNPDQGKKYLRDEDRINASRKALSYSIKSLHKKIIYEKPTDPSSAVSHHSGSEQHKNSLFLSYLLDAYKLFQQKQRQNVSETEDEEEKHAHRKLIVAGFQKYASLTIDTLSDFSAAVLYSNFCNADFSTKVKKSVSFCQQHLASISKAASMIHASQSCSSLSTAAAKINVKPVSTIKMSNATREGIDGSNVSEKNLKISTFQFPNAGSAAIALPYYKLKDGSDQKSSSENASVQLISCSDGGPNKSNISNNNDKADKLADPKGTPDSSPLKTNVSPNHPTEEKQSPSVLSGGEVTIVKSGTQSYTKITAGPKMQPPKLSPSPGSAFSATKTQEKDKMTKVDPRVERLMTKPPLMRSSSMPISVETSPELGSPKSIKHRLLQRSGSISDYTKQKLKSSILMRTSASLVRKPSITEQEIENLQSGDSSQSEEDDDEDCMEVEDSSSILFKPAKTEGCNVGASTSKSSVCWSKDFKNDSNLPSFAGSDSRTAKKSETEKDPTSNL